MSQALVMVKLIHSIKPMCQATLANPATRKPSLGVVQVDRNSQVNQVRKKTYKDERVFLKYINYIFGVLGIHFVFQQCSCSARITNFELG